MKVLRRFGTVRARTTIGATCAVAAALAFGAWFLLAQQRHSWEHGIATTAQLRASDLAAELRSGALPAQVAVPVEDEAFAQIADADRHVVRSSPNVEGEALIIDLSPAAAGRRTSRVERTPVGDTAFQVVAEAVEVGDDHYTVLVGQSMEPAERAVDSLARSLALALPALAILLGLMTWVVVGRALRPVEQIRVEVDAITEHDLHRRLRQPNTTDEIARLAATMNAMLDRVDAAVEQQRRFVADASHELRSPLTSIRAQLEVIVAHREDTLWDGVADSLLEDTMRLQRLVDDLLVVARLDAPNGAATRRLCDLDDIVVREVRRIRVRGAVEIDAHGVSAVQARVDPEGIARLVRNLLDNAERHATSQVIVQLRLDSDLATIIVADDGPGIPPDHREEIFERFTRLDDARSSDRGGAGLGLAIARQIAAAHGGELRLTPSETGATFVATLPL